MHSKGDWRDIDFNLILGLFAYRYHVKEPDLCQLVTTSLLSTTI